jgi:hypothetical protein
MSKRKTPSKDDRDKALSRRNLIIGSIVGITVILTFLVELPQKISAMIDVFNATDARINTETLTSSATSSMVLATPLPCGFCQDTGHGGTETITLSPSCLAAKIRIHMTQRSPLAIQSNYGYSLFEVEAYGSDTGSMNLVTGGTVTASTVQGNYYPAYDPQYTIDGNVDNPGIRWSSEPSDEPQWLEITLPQTQPIEHIVLYWENAYGVKYCIVVSPSK